MHGRKKPNHAIERTANGDDESSQSTHHVVAPKRGLRVL